MCTKLAIIPEFSDKETQFELFDVAMQNIADEDIEIELSLEDQIDLSSPIPKPLSYRLFLPTIEETLSYISAVENAGLAYHIDLSQRGLIHHSFIELYIDALSRFNIFSIEIVPILWRDQKNILKARELNLKTLKWS